MHFNSYTGSAIYHYKVVASLCSMFCILQVSHPRGPPMIKQLICSIEILTAEKPYLKVGSIFRVISYLNYAHKVVNSQYISLYQNSLYLSAISVLKIHLQNSIDNFTVVVLEYDSLYTKLLVFTKTSSVFFAFMG